MNAVDENGDKICEACECRSPAVMFFGDTCIRCLRNAEADQHEADAALGRLWHDISADDLDAFIRHIGGDVARTSPYVEVMAVLRRMADEMRKEQSNG